MATLKTVVINKDGLATVINEKDFQQGVHDLWSDKKDSEYIPDEIADEVFDDVSDEVFDDVSDDEESEEENTNTLALKLRKSRKK
jgi:hypothetical protein